MTSEGEEYGGEVKAQDFVTGLKHAADKKSQAIYWSKNLSKVWMIMFQGRHLISQLLVESYWRLHRSIYLEPTRKFLEFQDYDGDLDAGQWRIPEI